jgi:hypothetical protein
MLIYGGPVPHKSRRKLKLMSRTVNNVCSATPEYLRWSKSLITFHRRHHLDSIPKPKRLPLIVERLVRMTQLTKALMNAGSGLNLMFLDTFEGLGLTQDQLKISPHPFYGVVLAPSGRLLHPSPSETRAPTTPKHSSLRCSASSSLTMPCYIKFMVIPSYASLKLKILRPIGVITMEVKTQWVLDCEQSGIELATHFDQPGRALLIQSLQGGQGLQGTANPHRGPCQDHPN